MKKILQGWNFVRILRLVFGIIILIQGIVQADYLFAFIGVVFAALSVANIGCCGTQACATNIQTKSTQNIKDVSYEEVV
ncbi:MAG TPA: hypothetical protein PLW32_09440 [Chitinophagaceae bacterium]|jgi:uncharacterized membrane protein HdeD (DUF308 family)|nr:hypothetical protein [Chitinophagaceae bacterium]HPH24095.1 hypothetical protein [Chitinophagaceae bacterium]